MQFTSEYLPVFIFLIFLSFSAFFHSKSDNRSSETQHLKIRFKNPTKKSPTTTITTTTSTIAITTTISSTTSSEQITENDKYLPQSNYYRILHQKTLKSPKSLNSQKLLVPETPWSVPNKTTKAAIKSGLIEQKMVEIEFSYEPVKLPKNHKGWLIIAFLDIHYVTPTRLWYKMMKKVGYENFRLFAIDNLAYEELKKDVENKKLKEHQIALSEGYAELDPESVVTDDSMPSINATAEELAKYTFRGNHIIWKIRMVNTHNLLKQSYSVMLVDIDSIWNWYVDLDKLPMNFDVIHSVCLKNPGNIVVIWHWAICAGLALYRPTENTLKLWDNYQASMRFDDQETLNQLYRRGNVSWFDEKDCNQSLYYNSPIRYHKLGVLPKLLDRKFRGVTLEKPLQVMVVSPEEMKRGGKPKDCKNSWIMNPWTTAPIGYPKNTPRFIKKIEMFRKFENCTARDNITHALL